MGHGYENFSGKTIGAFLTGKRLDKVLERNHPPQIIWSVDLIRGVLF